MDQDRIPKPGEIYNHFKNKPYQIITVAMNAENNGYMVVYQALYGDFRTYVRTLDSFLSEVDHVKYPDMKQKYRFELQGTNQISFTEVVATKKDIVEAKIEPVDVEQGIAEDRTEPVEEKKDIVKVKIETEEAVKETPELKLEQIQKDITDAVDIVDVIQTEEDTSKGYVNPVLMQFLEAESFYKKLEVITSNRKHMNDRLINDIAVSLDCAVDEGPLDQRIQGLIYCLQAMCRFEDKRLR